MPVLVGVPEIENVFGEPGRKVEVIPVGKPCAIIVSEEA